MLWVRRKPIKISREATIQLPASDRDKKTSPDFTVGDRWYLNRIAPMLLPEA
jgi:hypothetical protein